MKNSFYLVIPEQKNNPQLLTAFADNALAQWVAELPTANPSLATRLFHDMIIDLIGLEMPAAKRLNALETLRANYLLIEDYLRSRLIKSGFPKGENEKKIFDLLVQIERQFTIGYWCVVRDLTRREIGWLQGKTTVLAIQRVIKGLSSIVITHYIMGATVPDWIWFDLHSLYKLSVKLGKQAGKVTDMVGDTSKTTTLEDCYKQILLLSLADPSGLMQKEFQQVYDFIEKISGLVHLEKHPIADQPIQCYVLMDEDVPPCFAKTQQAIGEDSARIYLDFGKLYKAIKQPDKFCGHSEARFSSLEVYRNNQQKLPIELFNYLSQRWLGQELQGGTSFTDRLDRFVAFGLDATHALQAGEDEVGETVVEYQAETDSERALACVFDKEGIVSIGSLVSYRKTDGLPQQRLLGVVCKLRLAKQDKKVIFEVLPVANQSFPVSYTSIDAAADVERKKALLYGVKSEKGDKSFIILDSFMLKDGDVLRMYMGSENFPIVLNDRKNIGLGYWQFECRRIEEKVLPTQEKKRGYDFI